MEIFGISFDTVTAWKGSERMYAIVNTNVILEEGLLWDGTVVFDEHGILAVGSRQTVQIPPEAQVIDAEGLYTAPGFVDIHNHGSEDAVFYLEPDKCARHFLLHGATTVLPTFYCNLTAEELCQGAERVKKASASGAGQILNGLYMEGPYMNGEGSNKDTILWTGEIRPEEYRPLVDRLAPQVRIWAIDPARVGIEGFMAYVKEKNPSAIFALGHSHATAAQCRTVAHYGVRVQTHHGDSGKAAGRAQGTIGAGCDEYTLCHPELYAELICDKNGIHVDSDMIRMVIRTKGVERIVLITDSMAAGRDPDTGIPYRNNEAEGILYGPDLNYDYEGHLAGSHLTMDEACRNVMAHSGYGLCHAVRFASSNPARLLGIDQELGSIAVGKRANLLVMNDRVQIRQVFLNGQLACENGALCL